MRNIVEVEIGGVSSCLIMEDLYKNVKELGFNFYKFCNMILCLSDFLGDGIENGLEWCKEF